MTKRGDVVLVDFPFTDVAQAKRRPALVIQNDVYNARIRKTVVAMITGNMKRLGDPCHLLVDPGTPEGASAGINGSSLVSCNNLFTIEQSAIRSTVGQLSDVLKQRLNDCIKAALDLT